MATISFLNKDFATQRRHSVVHPPGMSTPLYLGSRYEGELVQVDGVIEGSSYDDAKSALESIRTFVKNNEEVTIGGNIGTLPESEQITGKVERFSVAHRPATKYQRFSITLRMYT